MTIVSLSRLRQLRLVNTRFASNPLLFSNVQDCTPVTRSNGASRLPEIVSNRRRNDVPQIRSQQTETRAQIIKRKVAELKSRSTLKKSWCLKCGCPGHFIRDCRNAQLCFLCNGFGHKAYHCKAESNPSAIHKQTLRHTANPRSIPHPSLTRRFQPTSTTRTTPPSQMAYRAPIVAFEESPMSRAVEERLLKSFVLDDIAAWGPEKIERQLQAEFPHANHRWIASVFDDYKYLIQAPHAEWLESMASIGFIRL